MGSAKPERSLLVAAAGVGLVCIAVVVGLGVAVALPAWHKSQDRKHAMHWARECRFGLKEALVAARVHEQETDLLVTDFSKTGFAPSPGRYLYVADLHSPAAQTGPASAFAAAFPRATGLAEIERLASPGLVGVCPHCALTIACAGNLDGDATLDVWSISTADRLGPHGPVLKGEPFHHLEDATDEESGAGGAPVVP